jgi:hypothetical protein
MQEYDSCYRHMLADFVLQKTDKIVSFHFTISSHLKQLILLRTCSTLPHCTLRKTSAKYTDAPAWTVNSFKGVLTVQFIPSCSPLLQWLIPKFVTEAGLKSFILLFFLEEQYL